MTQVTSTTESDSCRPCRISGRLKPRSTPRTRRVDFECDTAVCCDSSDPCSPLLGVLKAGDEFIVLPTDMLIEARRRQKLAR
jgi:hypothetical protein